MTQPANWGPPLSGPATPADTFTRIKDSLDAALDFHSGPSAPAYRLPGTVWRDTSVAGESTFRMWDGAEWIVTDIVDQTNNLSRVRMDADPWQDVASAATVNLLATNSRNIRLTGTTTVTSFGAAPSGLRKLIRASALITIAFNATTLITPLGQSLVLAPGEICEAISVGTVGSPAWIVQMVRPSGRGITSPSALANNANIPVADSGVSYSMNLAGGVQIVNLPAVAGVPDGWSCIIRATGDPSGFQTASVRAETGKTIAYAGNAARDFFLIGRGEVFRFTWLAGLDLWLAECLSQPQPFSVVRTGTGGWNNSPTSFTALGTFLANGTVLPHVQMNSGHFQVAAAGVYEIGGQAYASSSAGGGTSGDFFIIGGTGASVANDRGYVFRSHAVSDGDYSMQAVLWSERLAPSDIRGVWFQASVATLFFRVDTSALYLRFLGR